MNSSDIKNDLLWLLGGLRATRSACPNGTGRKSIPRRRQLTALAILILIALAVTLAGTGAAHAAGTNMPWETPLNSLLDSLTGPIAKIAGVAAVVITGLGMAFSEGGSGMRKLVTVAFGLTIAFAATTFFLPLFGYAGGAAF